jgi:hypothetical protein
MSAARGMVLSALIDQANATRAADDDAADDAAKDEGADKAE